MNTVMHTNLNNYTQLGKTIQSNLREESNLEWKNRVPDIQPKKEHKCQFTELKLYKVHVFSNSKKNSMKSCDRESEHYCKGRRNNDNCKR